MTDHVFGEWHREVISSSTEATLDNLARTGVLGGFYLGGGTGLALQWGHRRSEDLDLFAVELFDEEALIQRVQVLDGFSIVARAPHSLHATIQTTKVSFLGYPYPVLFPLLRFAGVAVADVREIACMKLTAIAGRGTKRDFVDLYIAAQRFGLVQILRSFERKYAQAHYNKVQLLKSLTFFDDAEKDPMPQMLIQLDWKQVKRFFSAEVPRLI